MHKLLVYVICPRVTFASYLIVVDGIISLRAPSPLGPLPWQPGDHCPAAGEVTCVDMGECVMKSMAGRDHVGAFLVHGTCCVCRKVLVSSFMSKYIVISHIVTTIICIYLYFISPIFIYLTYHFIQRNTCFNLLCVLLLCCTVLWILIALFICCTCQKWRNKDVQSINHTEEQCVQKCINIRYQDQWELTQRSRNLDHAWVSQKEYHRKMDINRLEVSVNVPKLFNRNQIYIIFVYPIKDISLTFDVNTLSTFCGIVRLIFFDQSDPRKQREFTGVWPIINPTCEVPWEKHPFSMSSVGVAFFPKIYWNCFLNQSQRKVLIEWGGTKRLSGLGSSIKYTHQVLCQCHERSLRNTPKVWKTVGRTLCRSITRDMAGGADG